MILRLLLKFPSPPLKGNICYLLPDTVKTTTLVQTQLRQTLQLEKVSLATTSPWPQLAVINTHIKIMERYGGKRESGEEDRQRRGEKRKERLGIRERE